MYINLLQNYINTGSCLRTYLHFGTWLWRCFNWNILSKCYRNPLHKFKIDMIILTCLIWFLKVYSYVRTDIRPNVQRTGFRSVVPNPYYRKASLLIHCKKYKSKILILNFLKELRNWHRMEDLYFLAQNYLFLADFLRSLFDPT